MSKSSITSETFIVPEKVVSGFREHAMAKSTEAVDPAKPNNFMGKILHYTKKSTLITAPALSTAMTVGSFSIAISALGDNIFLYIGGILGATVSIIGGVGGIAAGAASISSGDREFAPLPVSKQYRELQEQAKAEENQVSIAPFDEWDKIFENNCLQPIENIK